MENEYEVEKILNKCTRNGKTKYLIKWKGYPESESSWEVETNLNCPTKVAQFEMSQKSKINQTQNLKRKKPETKVAPPISKKKTGVICTSASRRGQRKMGNNKLNVGAAFQIPDSLEIPCRKYIKISTSEVTSKRNENSPEPNQSIYSNDCQVDSPAKNNNIKSGRLSSQCSKAATFLKSTIDEDLSMAEIVVIRETSGSKLSQKNTRGKISASSELFNLNQQENTQKLNDTTDANDDDHITSLPKTENKIDNEPNESNSEDSNDDIVSHSSIYENYELENKKLGISDDIAAGTRLCASNLKGYTQKLDTNNEDKVTSSSETDNTNGDELTESSSESSNDDTSSEFITNEMSGDETIQMKIATLTPHSALKQKIRISKDGDTNQHHSVSKEYNCADHEAQSLNDDSKNDNVEEELQRKIAELQQQLNFMKQNSKNPTTHKQIKNASKVIGSTLSFTEIQEGYKNNSIGTMDGNSNELIQNLWLLEPRQLIPDHFICINCETILIYNSNSHNNTLRRHRYNCETSSEQNILISPANFRSLMLDVMSFVEKFGYTEISEINIPRNMNEINCNQLIKQLETKAQETTKDD